MHSHCLEKWYGSRRLLIFIAWGFVGISGCKIQDFFQTFCETSTIIQTQCYQLSDQQKPVQSWEPKFPIMHCKQSGTTVQCQGYCLTGARSPDVPMICSRATTLLNKESVFYKDASNLWFLWQWPVRLLPMNEQPNFLLILRFWNGNVKCVFVYTTQKKFCR